MVKNKDIVGKIFTGMHHPKIQLDSVQRIFP